MLEVEVTEDMEGLLMKSNHFAFGALPKDLGPHRKSLVNERKRILFVRDELISPMYLAFALRKFALQRLQIPLENELSYSYN